MDAEIGKLTMASRGKTAEEICPKCHAAHPRGARECPNCGVIFNKIKSSTSGSTESARAVPTPPAATVNPKIPDELDKRKKLCGVLLFLCIAGAGFYYLYVTFIESRIQAGGFQKDLNEFCALEISRPPSNRSAENDLFRTGKVLVVSERQEVTMMSAASGSPITLVQEQGIHPAWHKLSRRIRAKDPSDVDTLIRVHKILGKAGRYGELKNKVFNTHKIVLDVYDWKNQSFIGTKIFDPGRGGMFMTEDDYDAMVESVSDKAIAQFVESMDLQPQGSM